MKTPQPIELEIEMLKSRVQSLEFNEKWMMSRWLDWTKSTKDMGQKVMIALEQIVEGKK